MLNAGLSNFAMILVLVTGGLVGACSDKDAEIPNMNPLRDDSELDIYLKQFIENNAVPGLAVALISGGSKPVIQSKGYGVQGIDDLTPVTEHTSFWLASVSKAVMGVTMMIAEERGFIGLDDSIQALLQTQGLFSIDNPDGMPISFRHLAQHTSGIVDSDSAYICAYYVGSAAAQHDKLVNLVEDDEPCSADGPIELDSYLAAYLDQNGIYYDAAENFASATPGQQFNYSNVAAALAGLSLGLATGQNLAVYAQQEIFTPLDMSSSSWLPSGINQQTLAKPHLDNDGELVQLPVYELATWPDGGLRSSAADLALLLSNIMAAGESVAEIPALLSADSIAQLLPAENEQHGVFWGTSNWQDADGQVHRMLGHDGSDPGAFTAMYFDPKQQIGVVLLANGDDETIEQQAGVDLFARLLSGAAAIKADQ